ncbi:predicted protein [Sclerotinia sclerotiorum 1980 UF-70]|uniref:Uncharacterized protein n=1 Tax=Sclerotinia sclerotiorum (strain ATCC 18683 / 1980 / Ss-1) TaxID=665079 RepID=A7F1N3_SCLS1|nr:predicted protein [Sclerotinia sclerotiorum 1980 UF-70]EDN95625.1 predicted protein [Sclerotinia sclerotiorum 1980 UF-70]
MSSHSYSFSTSPKLFPAEMRQHPVEYKLEGTSTIYHKRINERTDYRYISDVLNYLYGMKHPPVGNQFYDDGIQLIKYLERVMSERLEKVFLGY